MRGSPTKHLSLRQALMLSVLVLLLSGCCNCPPPSLPPRAFAFPEDTPAFANQIICDYGFSDSGRWSGTPRDPKPDYANRCFVLARTTKQFFSNAVFDPTQPTTSPAAYRQLVRRVVSSSPRRALSAEDRITFPGYPDLRAFSRDHEALLKEEAGGAWQSYFQRGHWRMIFPFSHTHQARMAQQLSAYAKLRSPAVVHVVDFPGLTMNHAILIFDREETRERIYFATYDPNLPDQKLWLTFDRRSKTFRYPPTEYFPGGPIHVYEVYCGTWY